MNASIPHYFLFSESTVESSAAPGSHCGTTLRVVDRRPGASSHTVTGRWRIVLEAADGSSKFEASDDEELPVERLELLAVIRGLEAIPQPARVTLMTDSHYVNRGLRFGLQEWRQNGWHWERFGELSSIANADLWQRLDRTLQIHQVQCKSWRVDAPHDARPTLGSSATGPREIGSRMAIRNVLAGGLQSSGIREDSVAQIPEFSRIPLRRTDNASLLNVLGKCLRRVCRSVTSWFGRPRSQATTLCAS